MSVPSKLPNRRPLDETAADIHALERSNFIEVGKLLVEAKETCDHGEWLSWLEEQFAWSVDTAENYMRVYRLADKFRKIRNLKVGKVTLYDLTYEEENQLPAIIDALAKVATKQHLKLADAQNVIELAKLRLRYGNFPDATLYALQNAEESLRHLSADEESVVRKEWINKAVEALKATRPISSEAAEQIFKEVQRAHIEQLYGGKLPVPIEALDYLERLPSELRSQVLKRLRDAPEPLSTEQIRNICRASSYKLETFRFDHIEEDPITIIRKSHLGDAGHAADAEETSNDGQPNDDGHGDPAADTTPNTTELIEALRTVLHYARQHSLCAVSGITGSELQEIENYLGELHRAVSEGR
jgi:hypothetical protein